MSNVLYTNNTEHSKLLFVHKVLHYPDTGNKQNSLWPHTTFYTLHTHPLLKAPFHKTSLRNDNFTYSLLLSAGP
jgi:hypothetical protein